MVSGPLVVRGEKTNKQTCQISACEKQSLICIQATPPPYTHILLHINISQQTHKIQQRELIEAKRQQSILELPWQMMKG